MRGEQFGAQRDGRDPARDKPLLKSFPGLYRAVVSFRRHRAERMTSPPSLRAHTWLAGTNSGIDELAACGNVWPVVLILIFDIIYSVTDVGPPLNGML